MSKRRSPTNYRSKSPPAQIANTLLGPHPGLAFPPNSKYDLFSSNEESTQEEKIISPSNADFPSYLGENSTYNHAEKAFMKAKKEK